MKNANDVAKWMLEKIEKDRELYQADTVFEIEKRFGGQYVYENENGNMAIDRTVLKEFRKLTGKTIVWERGERYWRFRQKGDELGRQQVF